MQYDGNDQEEICTLAFEPRGRYDPTCELG